MTLDHAADPRRGPGPLRRGGARGRRVGRRTPRPRRRCCGPDGTTAFGDSLYADADRGGLPDAAVLASLGCGNPTAVAELREGERVLDLGSGGGIDVLLSARRVGPTGRAFGLDMTDEMLELARRNAAEAGVTNVEFRPGHDRGRSRSPAASVDVVISNCVINLAADKAAVFREIARVLRPGGRVGVSDIVADDSPRARGASRARQLRRLHRRRPLVLGVPGRASQPSACATSRSSRPTPSPTGCTRRSSGRRSRRRDRRAAADRCRTCPRPVSAGRARRAAAAAATAAADVRRHATFVSPRTRPASLPSGGVAPRTVRSSARSPTDSPGMPDLKSLARLLRPRRHQRPASRTPSGAARRRRRPRRPAPVASRAASGAPSAPPAPARSVARPRLTAGLRRQRHSIVAMSGVPGSTTGRVVVERVRRRGLGLDADPVVVLVEDDPVNRTIDPIVSSARPASVSRRVRADVR